MSHTPHELSADFPEYADKIHALRNSDPHFARLCDDYHEVNRTVHRIETNIEPADDQRAEEVRKARLRLKDEIYARLSA